jgi:beta-glucanase (GH16 family)
MRLSHYSENVKQSTCPWLLNLKSGIVQEIDIIETGKGKHYFTIHYNKKGGYYDKGYRVVQFRFPFKKEFYERPHLFSVLWRKRSVVWLVNNIPVAVSLRCIPFQELHPVVTNYNNKDLKWILVKRL